jgi:hypothetical protein
VTCPPRSGPATAMQKATTTLVGITALGRPQVARRKRQRCSRASIPRPSATPKTDRFRERTGRHDALPSRDQIPDAGKHDDADSPGGRWSVQQLAISMRRMAPVTASVARPSKSTRPDMANGLVGLF